MGASSRAPGARVHPVPGSARDYISPSDGMTALLVAAENRITPPPASGAIPAALTSHTGRLDRGARIMSRRGSRRDTEQ